MKRLVVTLVVCLLALPLFGRSQQSGVCSKGGQTVVMSGLGSSTTTFVQTYPGCTISVFNTGTAVLATLYNADGSGKSNPFVSDSNTGYWSFYADNGVYDVQASGTGVTSPFVIGTYTFADPASLVTIGLNGNTLTAAAGSATITIPNVTDTLVNLTSSQALTNKTLTAPVINSGALSGTFTGNITLSGALTLSGANTITAKNLEAVRFTDQFASIDAAIADCSGSKCLVFVPSTYAPSDCPSANNRVVWDFRGTVASANCINNDIAWNTDDGTVHAMTKTQMGTSDLANKTAVSHWFITNVSGATASGGNAGADGISSEVQLFGTTTGTINGISAEEAAVALKSTATGGAVTTIYGVQGYFVSEAGSTTTVGTVASIAGLGCFSLLGVVPTNCYSLYGADQAGKGSSRGYSLFLGGLGLLGFSAVSGNAGLKAEDNAHAPHDFLYVNNSNQSVLQAVNAAGLILADSAGASRFVLTSSSVTLDPPTTFTSGFKAGASGSNVADTRELLQTVHSCGTTTTCANTANGSYRMIVGNVTLNTGSAVITGITAFTSTSSYFCWGTDKTAAAAIKIANTSTTSITITGTGSDVVDYACVGN